MSWDISWILPDPDTYNETAHRWVDRLGLKDDRYRAGSFPGFSTHQYDGEPNNEREYREEENGED